ncbi:hypothetical protein C8D92_104103 [Tamilnaduibacter salinus]|uniref:Uncharacterized protein n=1 Tax=Tamilnaduibacter salinus TaxID=1484056 RepID=A0A2U1CXA6_9GAMM|nr:hypothetical protein [Tamilnaduibacter salinus]PVY76872.1 hypothetical protein C8D92_104103 [Tamilnaduibacter salinus]
MPTYQIHLDERQTLPERLKKKAAELGLTPEQLIRRFIVSGMADDGSDSEPAIPGEMLEDALIKNDVYK